MKTQLKKWGIRTLKATGILTAVLLLSVFVWANWEAPSPGMRAPVIDFVQYDLSRVTTDKKIETIQASLRKQPGITGVTFNPTSKLLVVAYAVHETERADFEKVVAASNAIKLKEKVFVKSGPKCPIDVAYISKVKKFFCVRD